MRTDWPGRPTRAVVLRPRGGRERFAAWLGRSLLERWDRELAAETMRADAGWEDCEAARRRLIEHGIPALGSEGKRDA